MKSNSSESARASEATAPPTRLLDGVRSPADIKALREQVCHSSHRSAGGRADQRPSQTGGHYGPNLGVVELTIAFETGLKTPDDRFVMDSVIKATSTKCYRAARSF